MSAKFHVVFKNDDPGIDVSVENLKIRDFAKTDFSDRFVGACQLGEAVDIKPGSDRNAANPFGGVWCPWPSLDPTPSK